MSKFDYDQKTEDEKLLFDKTFPKDKQEINREYLKVKILTEDELTDEDKKEREEIFKTLSKKYCKCQHRYDKHDIKTKSCNVTKTDFSTGKATILKCTCNEFISIEDQHLQQQQHQ